MATASIWAADPWRSSPRRATHPDAVCLLDRDHGLLFTGDTYYPAPIWLFRPETDLNAYDASIRRLAALAPQVTVVLGAHNIPVSPPSVLLRLVSAFEAVRAGKALPAPAASGKVLYQVEDFSFLMAAPPSKFEESPGRGAGRVRHDRERRGLLRFDAASISPGRQQAAFMAMEIIPAALDGHARRPSAGGRCVRNRRSGPSRRRWASRYPGAHRVRINLHRRCPGQDPARRPQSTRRPPSQLKTGNPDCLPSRFSAPS